MGGGASSTAASSISICTFLVSGGSLAILSQEIYSGTCHWKGSSLFGCCLPGIYLWQTHHYLLFEVLQVHCTCPDIAGSSSQQRPNHPIFKKSETPYYCRNLAA